MAEITPQQLEQLYANRFRQRERGRERIWQVLAGAFFQKWIPPGAVVLDLGAGYGEFLRNIRAGRKLGVDANRLATGAWGADIEAHHFDVTAKWPLAGGSVDCVFTSNFFEHLPDKLAVARCVEQIFCVLKPGGILIAMGPNIRRTGGSYWDFFDHFTPLTERLMSELLTLKGFQIDFCRASFLPYSMSRVNPFLTTTLFSLLLPVYLRLPFLWRWFGHQFLLVASRPR